MKFEIWTKALAELPVDCLAVAVHDDGELSAEARALDLRCREKLSRLLKRGDFSAKVGETWLVTDLEGLRAERVLLVGLGPKADLTRKAWRRAMSAAIAAALRTRVTSLALALPRPAAKLLSDERLGRAVAELTGNAMYRVNDLKSAKKPRPHALARLTVPVPAKSAQSVKKGFAQGQALASGAALMRNLANLPGNVCTPSYLGKTAEGLAKTHKSLRVKVLGLPEIKREKMGCFLAVTQGSEEPPRFIVIEHKHPRAKGAPVVLVGKGITFDTGGISLKDPPTMDEMKFDMSGAACVIGTMMTTNAPTVISIAHRTCRRRSSQQPTTIRNITCTGRVRAARPPTTPHATSSQVDAAGRRPIAWPSSRTSANASGRYNDSDSTYAGIHTRGGYRAPIHAAIGPAFGPADCSATRAIRTIATAPRIDCAIRIVARRCGADVIRAKSESASG